MYTRILDENVSLKKQFYDINYKYYKYLPNLFVNLNQNCEGNCKSTFLPIFRFIIFVGIIFLLNPSPLSTTSTIV